LRKLYLVLSHDRGDMAYWTSLPLPEAIAFAEALGEIHRET
jgi:hypothetical protein